MKQKLAYELQQRLVQCCIDFVEEKKNEEIEWVSFTVDNLQYSVKHGSWHPYSDSTCQVDGIDEETGDSYEIDFSA